MTDQSKRSIQLRIKCRRSPPTANAWISGLPDWLQVMSAFGRLRRFDDRPRWAQSQHCAAHRSLEAPIILSSEWTGLRSAREQCRVVTSRRVKFATPLELPRRRRWSGVAVVTEQLCSVEPPRGADVQVYEEN